MQTKLKNNFYCTKFDSDVDSIEKLIQGNTGQGGRRIVRVTVYYTPSSTRISDTAIINLWRRHRSVKFNESLQLIQSYFFFSSQFPIILTTSSTSHPTELYTSPPEKHHLHCALDFSAGK